ncbi:fumarylacetoacetate hydrolase [Mycobacterium saskatchewanense]|uniref:Fumarylacetoacetate hydrolase n=1 Tax=Mycobacterium saskatchewanense TaxID=220927 RepID=A0AAJ3NUH1_9MYCO|nr:fumarylacetoacetate hydrolase family protein [Mycobacterium saskatchewanense]ORW73708.1 fumarylacetoacetate hydrolase [Mycobacterium saskatchewanense]BBX65170.1 fumarylacetoacetate hydrolase [Mycobacterium saskatchewanense]
MRIASWRGRAVLVVGDDSVVDISGSSSGRFGPELDNIYQNWDEFRRWASTAPLTAELPFDRADLGPPAPRPRQVFAVGLNYAEHAQEGNVEVPTEPVVFTKFPASISGPYADIPLSSPAVDYEAEVVAVIGREAYHVEEARAWDYVAGLTCGQDISDRRLQLAGPAPQQFSLAKSFTGFGPIGPWLVTIDEFGRPLDVALRCTLNGDLMQSDRTRNMLFSIPQVVAYLSSILTLWPGDLIFTGTPAGVGWARNPQVTLSVGDVVTTEIEGIGTMSNRCVASKPAVVRSI